MTGITLTAYGKINLSLDVLHLRADGYHELATVMQSIALGDSLAFQVNDTGNVNLECNRPELANSENLVVKGARLLRERYCPERGVDILLEKRLPVAAGLGGGSSDAAATLKALNHLWGLGLSTSSLIVIGAELGADVPFCLVGGTVLAQGIGDKLTLLKPAPTLWLVLVKPPGGLRAGEVYQCWDAGKWESSHYTPGVLAALEGGAPPYRLLQKVGNDLERAVKSLLPEAEEIEQDLLQGGALKAMVSGSGPTIIGFVADEEQAIKLANSLSNKYPEVHVTHTI